VAIAGMWSQPFDNIFPGSAQRDQYGVETYWNIAMTPESTLTPGHSANRAPLFQPQGQLCGYPEHQVQGGVLMAQTCAFVNDRFPPLPAHS